MKYGRKRMSGIFSLLLALVLVLSACSGGNSSTGKSAGNTWAASQQLNVTTTSDIPTLDYTQATDTQSTNTLQMVNSGLTRMHNGKVQWDLAKGAPTVSADKMTFTFTLRNGIKWSDGKHWTRTDRYGYRNRMSKSFNIRSMDQPLTLQEPM